MVVGDGCCKEQEAHRGPVGFIDSLSRGVTQAVKHLSENNCGFQIVLEPLWAIIGNHAYEFQNRR